MKGLTVAVRLSVGFGVITFLMLIIGVIGIDRLRSANEAIGEIVGNRWIKISMLQTALASVGTIDASYSELVLAVTNEAREAASKQMLQGSSSIEKELSALKHLLREAREQELMLKILDTESLFLSEQNQIHTSLNDMLGNQARTYLVTDFHKISLEYGKRINELIGLQSDLIDQAAKSAAERYRFACIVMITLATIALFLATVIAIWIIRSITKPLGGEPDEAKVVVERISQGDLTAEIGVKPGDSGSLIFSMQAMQANLRRMVSDLKSNAEGVSAVAHRLALTSSKVASATEQQSEATSAVASAVEEMAVGFTHLAERAHDARSITTQTDLASMEGNSVIQETVADMLKISNTVGEAAKTIQAMGENSKQISRIVHVIKDVADQTNLLALNAAIEAARAGEQGRGFAVVADEVRKLAERTAKATTEIADMISSVQSNSDSAVATMQQAVLRVEQGLEKVQKAGGCMLGISDGSQNVVSAVNEISSALQEQVVACNEIAHNVEKIAQMSEENSTATREAAKTAQQLGYLAASTHEAVGAFSV